jgi:pilus assembly protein CpaF
MEQIKEELQKEVIGSIDLGRDISDEELLELIDRVIIQKSRENYISMQAKIKVKKDIFNSIRRLDLLQELIEDPEITEIMVNGTKKIFIEKEGAIYPYDKCFESGQKLEDVVQNADII